MAVMSKRFFDNAIEGAVCNKLLHPDFKQCSAAQFHIFKHSLKGCFKFFLAIYVIDLIIKHKKVNKAFLEKHVKNFFRSYVYGLLYTNVFYISLCYCRYLVGSYPYYSAVGVPGTLGGLTIFCETPLMKNLNSVMYFSMTLEVIILYLTGENIIKRSVLKDTFCFMIYNSFYLYLMKHNPLSKEACSLWFFNPKEKAETDKNIENNKCCKTVICFKHLFQEGLKYFTTGYTFQLVRYSVKNTGQIIRKPSTFITNLFSKKALKTGLFFSSYVTIYKLMCRVLHEFDGKEKSNHSLLAGFIAGISYFIDPSLQINVLPLSMVLQILWINIRTKYKIPKWYLKELFFALCSGILIHCFILAPDYCPKYIKNMVYVALNGNSRILVDHIYAYINSRAKMNSNIMK